MTITTPPKMNTRISNVHSSGFDGTDFTSASSRLTVWTKREVLVECRFDTIGVGARVLVRVLRDFY